MAERQYREKNAPPGIQTTRRNASTEKMGIFKNRVYMARRVRDEWQTKYKLRELYNAFYGDMASSIFGDEAGSSDFFVNKMLPTIKTVIPSLFLQNPQFVVRSKVENTDPTTVLRAKMGEALLKAIADQEHHLEFSIKLALLQSFFSIGVLKAVFEPKLIPNPRAGETVYEREPSGIPILNEAGEMTEVFDEFGGILIEPDKIVDDESYRWDWVNGDKMLLPNAGPAHLRWPWIAEEVTVSLDDAREDERFPKNLRTQLKSNTSGMDSEDDMSYEYRPSSSVMGDYQDEYLMYVELWDIRKRRHYIWAEGQTFSNTQFLLDEETPEGVEDHPYPLLLGFTPIIAPKSCPWPLPYTYSWLPLQQEHNIRRRQLANGAKRTARKVFFEDGTFEDADQAVAFMQSSTDMQGVKVNTLERPPQVHTDPPLALNVAQDMALLEADWSFETGVSGARTGGRNKGPDSVYETKTQVASGEVRDLDMRHSVNVWLGCAAKKMLRLLRSTMTLSMYVKLRGTSDTHYLNYVAKVYGPEVAQNLSQFPNLRHSFDQQFGSDKWIEMSGEDLDFEADVSVAPGSARPRNMEAEKQDFFEILQILGSVPIVTQSRALLTRVADMFEFFDVSMIDEILAAGQKANELEQIKAGRHQGNQGGGQQQPSQNGSFQQNFVG